LDIVITLAGKSRRFKKAGYSKPKFLLEVDYKPILLHVIDMFSKDDTFHFIFNKNQIPQNPEILDLIKSKILKYNIVEIEPHEKGPVYSCLKLDKIPKNKPLIITYCDFYVEWDYVKFQNSVQNYDMVIPSFRGFHPASYGQTTYAYSNVNEKNELIELKEKESFTNNRVNEYANSGIYFFKNWKIFENNAIKLLDEGYGKLKEGYVSLIANIIKKNGGEILITEIEKFICLGTPEDYLMYKFWSEFFLAEEFETEFDCISDVNLIPMAGLGSRFKKESYDVLKPLIQIGKQSMFLKSSNSFPKSDKWIFIFRDSIKFENSNLQKLINQNFVNNKVEIINELTSGQAATCLLAKKYFKPNKSLFIASCDYISIYNKNNWKDAFNDNEIDVYIWTFKTKNILVRDYNAFAYCTINKETNLVKEIVEKSTISNDPGDDQMVIGSFWFRNSNDFVNAAENSIENNINVNGEHYIANSLNHLISIGKKIKIFEVEKWISFGDPFELNVYYYWEDLFFKKYKQNKLF
jgi:NDP-sugar pyrophosphorylase family protein